MKLSDFIQLDNLSQHLRDNSSSNIYLPSAPSLFLQKELKKFVHDQRNHENSSVSFLTVKALENSIDQKKYKTRHVMKVEK